MNTVAKAALVIKEYNCKEVHMKPKTIKKILMKEINEVVEKKQDFVMDPSRDFIRDRKLPFVKMLQTIIGMGGGTLTNELLDHYKCSVHSASSSAFVQQREKIKDSAFETIFRAFTNKISATNSSEKLRILAVDGSGLQIATNEKDKDTFYPGSKGQKPYNLLHLNALYDLEQHLYLDAIIQNGHNHNEHQALVNMVDDSSIDNALVIADRGYESYNNMAHIQEKGWFFLIRVKDGKHGIKDSFELPDYDEYDVKIDLNLTRKQTKEIKELLKDRNRYRFIATSSPFDYLPLKSRKHDPVQFYNLKFRIVRFKITEDTYETILTNLNEKNYPPKRLKEMYASRWGVETSFRDLKYTVGLVNFHSKKVMCIRQEIFAKLTMYNFSEMITSHVIIKKREKKYTYKANFTVAVHVCRIFFRGQTTSPNVETIIAQNITPIRPNRHRKRKLFNKSYVSFLYRVA